MNAVMTDDLVFVIPAHLEACVEIRDKVNEIAAHYPFSNDNLDEIKIAVGEAASNAVKHGCRNRPWAFIEVRCRVTENEFSVEIKDDGPGFEPARVNEPDFLALPEGGMGIYCMRHAMDSVSFSFEEGTKVTLVKRFNT